MVITIEPPSVLEGEVKFLSTSGYGYGSPTKVRADAQADFWSRGIGHSMSGRRGVNA
jgi:hypothetical protein